MVTMATTDQNLQHFDDNPFFQLKSIPCHINMMKIMSLMPFIFNALK